MKVRPLGDKLIIKRADPQTRTDSGIYLPDSAKDKPKEGKIVALGNGLLNKETGDYMPFTVKKGLISSRASRRTQRTVHPTSVRHVVLNRNSVSFATL